jgi:hypothetical protein
MNTSEAKHRLFITVHIQTEHFFQNSFCAFFDCTVVLAGFLVVCQTTVPPPPPPPTFLDREQLEGFLVRHSGMIFYAMVVFLQ